MFSSTKRRRKSARGLPQAERMCDIANRRERKKHIKKKTRKQKFHGIVPGFLGNFVYVFSSPLRNDPKKTHKQIFGTHPVLGQSRKFVYVYVFFFPWNQSQLNQLRDGKST